MKKYKVTQEFMEELNNWKREQDLDILGNVCPEYLIRLPEIVRTWHEQPVKFVDRNKRLIAVINWINGEEVFEVGMPSYIVQRNEINSPYGREYIRIAPNGGFQVNYYKENATRFDDFKKASEWANKHFEVVEVNGNEL